MVMVMVMEEARALRRVAGTIRRSTVGEEADGGRLRRQSTGGGGGGETAVTRRSEGRGAQNAAEKDPVRVRDLRLRFYDSALRKPKDAITECAGRGAVAARVSRPVACAMS
ncbi:hypothetical protein M2317_000144 [Microbacterium sp. ZKA21]|jgi:hypothetical protein|uniref:hypothetical protein n=1 Tax=Microbacterium sp. ZKA21 TaxID=3381694 RepID=UPI003D25686F